MNELVDNFKSRLRRTDPVDYTAEKISGEVTEGKFKKNRSKSTKSLRRSTSTETKYLDNFPFKEKPEEQDTVSLRSFDSSSTANIQDQISTNNSEEF